MLKKQFNDIYILIGKIVENKNLDEENLHSVAFEILFSIIEKYPKLISSDEEKLSNLITEYSNMEWNLMIKKNKLLYK